LGCLRIGECGGFGWGGSVVGIQWVGCAVWFRLVDWELTLNRRVVTRNVLTPTSLPYPTTSNTDTLPPPRRRSISSSSYLSTNPDHHVSNILSNPISNPRSTHSRRSSVDTTRRMSSVREESKSEDSSLTGVEAAIESVSERIRKSTSLHVRPGMIRK